jgi:pimeloyl-ACP methyl ester carboxylesterase
MAAMQAVEIRGSPVMYEEIGEGRPILLLHGWPGDHRQMTRSFEPIFADRSGWRRIYIDMPGMGQTKGPDRIRTQDDMLAVPIELMDALAPGARYSVAGVSYGGYLAHGMVRLRGPRLDGVLLVAPAVRWDGDERSLPERRVFVEASAELAASLDEAERNWLRMSVVQTAANLAGFREGILPGLRAADFTFLDRLEGSKLSFDGEPLPEPFDKPSLIIAGRQDIAVGYRDAADLMDQYTRATFAALDRAGHGLRFEQATLFAGLVNEWLDRVELEAPAG